MKRNRVINLDGSRIRGQPIALQDSPKGFPIGVDVTSDERLRLLLALDPDRPVLGGHFRPSVPMGVVVGHGVLHRALALQLLPADAVAHHGVLQPNRLDEEVELAGTGPGAAQNVLLLFAGVQIQSARPGRVKKI